MTVVSTLPRSDPETQGVSSDALSSFIGALETHIVEIHSIMVLRRGRVIAEGWWHPYRAEDPHRIFSVSKSFTSTAIGFAVAEGRLTIDDLVLSLFPREAPEKPDKHLKALRVRHLLTMSAGTVDNTEPNSFTNWLINYLRHSFEYAPGTRFSYNNGACYLLSIILHKLTGMPLLHYLKPRLFDRLGIVDAAWDWSTDGINNGAHGLKIKTEDMARFGQFYLQQGMWNGEQVLPKSWVAQATSAQVVGIGHPKSDWLQGYGFQFWCCSNGAFRASGGLGQHCIVLPEQEAVIAITAGITGASCLFAVISKYLIPAMGSTPLSANPKESDILQRKLAALKLPGVAGLPTSPLAFDISRMSFILVQNELAYRGIRFDFLAADYCKVRLSLCGHGEHLLVCRMNSEWQLQRTRFNVGPQRSVPKVFAASGAWTDPDTFTFRLHSTDTLFRATFICRFEERLLKLEYRASDVYRPEESIEILGWHV